MPKNRQIFFVACGDRYMAIDVEWSGDLEITRDDSGTLMISSNQPPTRVYFNTTEALNAQD